MPVSTSLPGSSSTSSAAPATAILLPAPTTSMASTTMTAPNDITRYQDAFVEKIIDTLNDLPNVLWIVSEEAPSDTEWFNYYQIAHIRKYEAGKPHQHPIGLAGLL